MMSRRTEFRAWICLDLLEGFDTDRLVELGDNPTFRAKARAHIMGILDAMDISKDCPSRPEAASGEKRQPPACASHDPTRSA